MAWKTTVLAETLAWGLAEQGQKTFLMDAAGGWSTLSVGMDFEPSTTLSEAIRAAENDNEDSLGRMMHKPHEKLTILSSGGDVMLDDLVQPGKYEELLDMLMGTYPVIVIDLSAATPRLKRTLIKRAHHVLLVTSPALPAVRAGRTLLQEIKTVRGGSDEQVSVIVNCQNMTKSEVPKKQILEGLEIETASTIDYDPDLFAAHESRGEKITEDKKGAKVARTLLGLVGEGGSTSSRNTNEDDKKGLGKLIGMLKAST